MIPLLPGASPAPGFFFCTARPPRARSTTRAVIVKVRLTKDEHDKIRQVAADRNVQVPTLARDLLLEATTRSDAALKGRRK